MTNTNSITVKPIQTSYGYQEDYIIVDGLPITQYLAQAIEDNGDAKWNGSVFGLYPAWGNQLLHKAEIRFIWDLIMSEEPTHLPILVCPDDLDLSCMVVVTSVHKDQDYVYWDKIGYIVHENEKFSDEREYGILHLDSYTNDDWNKYGSNIATERVDSYGWCKWISENWDDELYRRMNYTFPYYQNDKNVVWLKKLGFIFSKEEYRACVSIFQNKLFK